MLSRGWAASQGTAPPALSPVWGVRGCRGHESQGMQLTWTHRSCNSSSPLTSFMILDMQAQCLCANPQLPLPWYTRWNGKGTPHLSSLCSFLRWFSGSHLWAWGQHFAYHHEFNMSPVNAGSSLPYLSFWQPFHLGQVQCHQPVVQSKHLFSSKCHTFCHHPALATVIASLGDGESLPAAPPALALCLPTAHDQRMILNMAVRVSYQKRGKEKSCPSAQSHPLTSHPVTALHPFPPSLPSSLAL